MLNIELFGGKMATEIKLHSFDKSFKKKMQKKKEGDVGRELKLHFGIIADIHIHSKTQIHKYAK